MIIVKFEKESCNPCTMVSGFLDDNDVSYIKVNPYDAEENKVLQEYFGTASNTEFAMKHGVMTVPVVIVFSGHEEVKRSTGYKPGELEEIIELVK